MERREPLETLPDARLRKGTGDLTRWQIEEGVTWEDQIRSERLLSTLGDKICDLLNRCCVAGLGKEQLFQPRASVNPLRAGLSPGPNLG